MNRPFTPLYVRPPEVDLGQLPGWCRGIARKAAARYGVRGQAALDDIAADALVKCLELLSRFSPVWPEGYENPNQAFKGWAFRAITTTCQREAARLLAGGTIRFPRRQPGRALVIARPISDLQTDDDDSFDPPAPGSPEAESDPDAEAPRGDARRLGRDQIRVGRLLTQFLHAAAELGGRPLVLTAEVEPGGIACYQWADGRGSHRAFLHPDGSIEYAPAPRPD